MTISVEIIKDSIAPSGKRLTTFVLKYPRFIHSEFMTHRMISRNASSSRAIPFERQLKMIEEDMAMPLQFRKNQKGMQAGDALSEKDQAVAEYLWKESCRLAMKNAKDLALLNVHKQYINRLLEPFAHITVVATATEWSNFFALRYHKDAQPEICELAKQMWKAYIKSEPKKLEGRMWHLPFVSDDEISNHLQKEWYMVDDKGNVMTDASISDEDWLPLIRKSVARCARVSYLNHDGTQSTQEQDDSLFDRLLGNQPIHASPAEHQAFPLRHPHAQSGNLFGWFQFRKTLTNENITEFTGPLDESN